jgi:uncharacterized protein YcsI (UPF0317 family)
MSPFISTPNPEILHQSSLAASDLRDGYATRLAARKGQWSQSTSGVADTYLQANILVLPSRYADDFRNLCARNPVPCPLIAESAEPGNPSKLKSYLPRVSDQDLAANLDIRTDCPRYNVYSGSKLIRSPVGEILSQWSEDHFAFIIGCSQSFESALIRAGLEIRHLSQGRTVPMYYTNVPLNPSGVFSGSKYVVSMRPFKRQDIELVREITRRYLPTHGEPVAWGWKALEQLGIENIDRVQWGHEPQTADGRPLSAVFGDDNNVPVFWGCGVTPQAAVMNAALEGTIMAHYPGEMLVMDCREDDVL